MYNPSLRTEFCSRYIHCTPRWAICHEHNVADHPWWLFCAYELQALGLPLGHDSGFAPSRQWFANAAGNCCLEAPVNVSNPVWSTHAGWRLRSHCGEVHVCKPSTYVLKSPKLGALREVACDNIYQYCLSPGTLACKYLLAPLNISE